MNDITNSLGLTISEYGKEVRKYNDTNRERFNACAKQIINEHLDKYSSDSNRALKNITIQIYQF